MKLARVLVTMFALAATVAGCASEPMPGMRLEPVTKFSLGSAKFTPFKKRPTAEQLRAAVLKLYDSVDSAALSGKLHATSYDSDAPKGSGFDVQIESRTARPGKYLELRGSFIDVGNGKKTLYYDRSHNTYSSGVVKDAGKRHNRIAEWIGLPYRSHRARLLSDSVVNGVSVFVLELTRPPKEHNKFAPWARRTIRLYLGKNDLLLRRRETSEKVSLDSVFPENTTVTKIDGFVINSGLSDDLFRTEPPKGAKPMRSQNGVTIIE